MLPLLVILAEIGVVAWFVIYGALVLSMYWDGRDLPLPRMDAVSRSLIASVKYGYATGIAAVSVYLAATVYYG